MSKIKLQKLKNSVGSSVQRIHNNMMKLEGQPEASSLQILSMPKSIDEPEEMNLDFIVGQTGNPSAVAAVMIEKAKIDLPFAEFCSALLVELEKKMKEEGIEDKIKASAMKTEEIIEQQKALMKKKKENGLVVVQDGEILNQEEE